MDIFFSGISAECKYITEETESSENVYSGCGSVLRLLGTVLHQ